MARHLPSKHVMPALMEQVGMHHRSEDAYRRRAVLVALAVSAEGCCEAFVAQITQLLPLLYGMRCSCEAYNIGNLEDAMLAAGGTHYGVIPTTKFASCITTLFPRLGITEESVLLLVTTYGCGDKVPERSSRAKLQPFDMFAWADFAEDVQKAVDHYLGMEKLPGRARDIYPIGIRY